MSTDTVPNGAAAAEQARRCWRTLEPFHGVVYFAPEAAEEYAALGVHGRSGYFLSRAAAMGRVNAATITATFYNFHPDLVAASVADAPADVAADALLDARLRAMDRVLRDRLGDQVGGDDMRRAATLARRAADGLPERCVGRPLGLAHASLPIPDDPHLALWWAITALREYRGDGHLSALVDAELSGIEALIVHAATGDVPAETLRTMRAWSEDEWAAGVDGLASRGIVDGDGSFTAEGAALRQAIEDRTDRLAAPAWAQLDESEAKELRGLVRPWSAAVFAGVRPS